MRVDGVIHSHGVERLNFTSPTTLDPASGIPDEVIKLPNEPIAGPDFFI
jgi:hypothetical protein